MNDYLASLIRTVIPAGVAWAIAALANLGVTDIDGPQVAAAVTSIVFAVYYAIVRWAETRYPWLGWLLGLPKPPSY